MDKIRTLRHRLMELDNEISEAQELGIFGPSVLSQLEQERDMVEDEYYNELDREFDTMQAIACCKQWKMAMPVGNDVHVKNHGSIFLFTPMNERATQWMIDHTDGMWYGPSLVVEHRYAWDFAEALIEEGFIVT